MAINNLLTNAIKYNRPGGDVVLGAEESEERVRIFVRDSGHGIEPEEQERIFDKFYRSESQATRDVRGHGLGLSLSKEIVEMHMGELLLESTPGVGSEFSIVLKKSPMLRKEAV